MRRIICTPLAVSTIPDISPTASAKVASSKGCRIDHYQNATEHNRDEAASTFCICPRSNWPRSPPRAALLQSDSCPADVRTTLYRTVRATDRFRNGRKIFRVLYGFLQCVQSLNCFFLAPGLDFYAIYVKHAELQTRHTLTLHKACTTPTPYQGPSRRQGDETRCASPKYETL